MKKMTNRHWRYSVKLASNEALRTFLDFRGMSYRELAEKAGCSKALIGFLATGKVTHTSDSIAKGIAKTLDVPLGALFLPEVSTVSQVSRGKVLA